MKLFTKPHQTIYDTHITAEKAWISTLAAALFNSIGMLLEIKMGANIPEMPFWPQIISSLIGFVIILILIYFRKRPSYSIATSLFFLNAVAVTIALMYTNPHYAMSDHHWFPFQANKIGCLFAGAIAPGFGIGVVSILIHAGSAVAQYLFFDPALQSKIAHGEPIATIAFALAAIIILVYRLNILRAQQEFHKKMAEAAAVKHFAQEFLQMRDLMNTPLQTIDLCLNQLRGQHADQNKVLDALEGSVLRLNEINKLLKKYEMKIEWNSQSESFDSSSLLKKNNP